MNVVLIQSVIKTLSFLIISVSSLFNSYEIKQESIGINNADKNKSSSIINTIIDYDTEIIYNSKIPSGVTNVLVEGQSGIVYLDGSGNVFKTLKERVNEVVEVGVGKYGEYRGVLTGYGPDCDTCDGRGYVACPTQDGKWLNLIKDGIYYSDQRYGKLQIIAADWREFPCGTVVEISNGDLDEPIYGVVLDTGSAMRKAYDNGYVHIDVAFKSESELSFDTNKNTSFKVKRWGW